MDKSFALVSIHMTAGRKKRGSRKASLPPRRLRMNRERRLVAAVWFLRGFTGKNVVRGYARWFGVDLCCALLELQMLGVRVDPTYVDRVRATLREKERIGRQRNEQRRRARAATDRCAEFEFESLSFDDVLEPPTGIPF